MRRVEDLGSVACQISGRLECAWAPQKFIGLLTVLVIGTVVRTVALPSGSHNKPSYHTVEACYVAIPSKQEKFVITLAQVTTSASAFSNASTIGRRLDSNTER